MMRSTSSDHAPMRRIHNRGIRAWRSLYSSYHILYLYYPTTILNFPTTINLSNTQTISREKKKERKEKKMSALKSTAIGWLLVSLGHTVCYLSILLSPKPTRHSIHLNTQFNKIKTNNDDKTRSPQKTGNPPPNSPPYPP